VAGHGKPAFPNVVGYQRQVRTSWHWYNVGPGLGPIIGPSGNFTSLPDSAKWLLAFGMLLGRLEFFTVLVILSPAFWRR
jgi:hypothetical protein